jgi:hypothetical protein
MLIDERLHELFKSACSAWERGIPGHRDPGPYARKIFSTQYLIEMGTRLTLPEVTILLEAETVRSKALIRARSGDFAGSEQALWMAKQLCEQINLSTEAALAADTYHTAAQAFLEYKRHRYKAARRLLLQSLDSSGVLNDEFGYKMEMRRLHLGRNIARVEAVSLNYCSAIRHTVSLLRYIEGIRKSWPFSETREWRVEHPLLAEEGWWCLDELLGEIVFLVEQSEASVPNLLIELERYLATPIEVESFQRVKWWLEGIRAATLGDINALMENATHFFASETCYLKNARQTLLEKVVQQGNALAASGCAALTDT